MPENILRDEITIQADTQHLRTVREFIARLIGQSKLDERARNRVVLAVDEAVANVIQHGYKSRDDGMVSVIVEVADEFFRISIQDSGVCFNPTTPDDVNLENHLAAHRKRGLGIFLMRKIMDEVHYNYREGTRNELILVKYITPAKPSIGE